MTPDSLEKILSRFGRIRVLVLGDLMLDEYVWGDVARVSPDAPVQVVDIRRRSHAIGGAGNVAHNVRVAGAAAALVGVVGDDAPGSRVKGMIEEVGIDVSGIVPMAGRPTTVKTRVVARGQQIVRLDSEDRSAVPARDRATLLERALRIGASCDAVLVSDYAKGVVDRSLVREIATGLAASGRRVPIVVDPKLTDFSAYRGCDAITPNRKEAEVATGLTLRDESDLREAARRIRESSGAAHVLITLGERGMALSGPDGGLDVVPAQAREVYDVTGAGDTVLAYFALGLAAGAPAVEASLLANLAAGIAVAKLGTTAVAPAEIRAVVAGSGGVSAKVTGGGAAIARVEHERSLGRSIVFTNGCFDLLHAGHVHLLEKAKALGDFLVVGLNSDGSVRRLKGPDRPLVHEVDRVKVLAALDAVDLVVVFDEDTPLELIRSLRPDVLVKGGDYAPESIVGADEVRASGGRVTTVPMIPGLSTTALLDSIRKAERSR